MSSFIQITINGTVLPGVSNSSSMGGFDLNNHTQIYSLYSDTNTASNKSGTLQQGSVQASPYAILKPLDGISPMLRQAMFLNHVVQATIRIFGSNANTGEPMLHYEIELKNARIVGIRQEMQQPVIGTNTSIPPMERILISPQTVKDRSLQSNFSYENAVSPTA